MVTSAASLQAHAMYGQMNRLADQFRAGSSKESTPASADFAALVKNQLTQVLETGKGAEQAQSQLVAGKADLVDVVTALAETETALETMVAVRDRVIAAYEEIMRMPI